MTNLDEERQRRVSEYTEKANDAAKQYKESSHQLSTILTASATASLGIVATFVSANSLIDVPLYLKVLLIIMIICFSISIVFGICLYLYEMHFHKSEQKDYSNAADEIADSISNPTDKAIEMNDKYRKRLKQKNSIIMFVVQIVTFIFSVSIAIGLIIIFLISGNDTESKGEQSDCTTITNNYN